MDRQRLRTNHLTPGQRWVSLLGCEFLCSLDQSLLSKVLVDAFLIFRACMEWQANMDWKVQKVKRWNNWISSASVEQRRHIYLHQNLTCYLPDSVYCKVMWPLLFRWRYSRTRLSRTTGYLEQIPISPRFPIGLSIVIPSPDISKSRYVEQILFPVRVWDSGTRLYTYGFRFPIQSKAKVL